MRNQMIVAVLLATLVVSHARGGVPTIDVSGGSMDQPAIPEGRFLLFPLPVDRILEPTGRSPMIGLFGGPNVAMHSGLFTISENGIVCCTFEDGTGVGLVLGLKAFIPIADRIDITPRISYETRPGKFTTLGEPLPILGANNQVQTMRFEDELNVDLQGLAIDPMASYTLTDFGLYIVLGPSISFVMSKGFTKDETIATPVGVVYKTGGTTKRLVEGDIENVESTQIGGRGGLGARIAVTDAICVNPEVLYTVPFMKVTSVDAWKTSALQGTIGILINL